MPEVMRVIDSQKFILGQEVVQPQGVGVVIEATHLCAVMRGVRKPGTVMTTSAVLGLFRSRDKTRSEFLAHLERRAPGV